MKLFFILFILCCYNLTFAQKNTPQQYIEQYANLAQKEMKRTGVPASITLAQGILESESGNSDLASKSSNHFGIKCKTEWTGEKVYHNDDARGECFRKYENVEQSFIDHSDFLKSRAHYAFLFLLDPTDYQGWAKGLKKAGYATNPTYAQKLIGLIEKYELFKYDDLSMYIEKERENTIAPQVTEPIIELQSMPVADEKTTTTPPEDEDALQKDLLNSKNIKTQKINGLKAIKASRGASMFAIAEQHNISLSKLLAYNDYEESYDEILKKETVLYLQKKKKQGSNATHIVVKGETLHAIAQQYGIRMDALLRMNGLQKDAVLKEGISLTLQTNSVFNKKK